MSPSKRPKHLYFLIDRNEKLVGKWNSGASMNIAKQKLVLDFLLYRLKSTWEMFMFLCLTKQSSGEKLWSLISSEILQENTSPSNNQDKKKKNSTLYFPRKLWRCPVVIISTSLSNVSLTGRLRRYDGTEATAARKADLVSFPPKPPPIRLTLQTTFDMGRSRTWATYFWCFWGAYTWRVEML